MSDVTVTCPNCGESDLMGPLSEGFQCYKCGWSYHYGLLTTKPYYQVWKSSMSLIHNLEEIHLLKPTQEEAS